MAHSLAGTVFMVLGCCGVASLVMLTAVGSYRRGCSRVVSLVCGAAFPLAWIAWYVIDERPYRRLEARQRP